MATDYGGQAGGAQPLLSRGRRRFGLVTVALIAGVAVCASAALWQWRKAQTKQAWVQAQQHQAELPAWGAEELAADPQQGWHRPVRLEGEWRLSSTIWLENRSLDGRAGFLAVTPLWVPAMQRCVLVQRGWVPRDVQDRQRVPALPTPHGAVLVSGQWQPTLSQRMALGAEAAELRLRQNWSPDAAEKQTGCPMLQGVIWAEPSADDAAVLQRYAPVPAQDVHKHYNYAAQWVAFALIQLGLYVWYQFIAPWRAGRRAARDDRPQLAQP